MGMYDELPVYKAGYDLLLEIFQFVRNFSKEFKYTVGDNMKTEGVELIKLIYQANSTRDKLEIIRQARERIETIRLYLRLMKDLRQINIPKFVSINEKIENVSKQLAGWQKSLGRNNDC
ncbi:MAG: four helix bundle protein [Odoribacter sp.]|nr:four helix bundle protein [Odoribacter sp.]